MFCGRSTRKLIIDYKKTLFKSIRPLPTKKTKQKKQKKKQHTHTKTNKQTNVLFRMLKLVVIQKKSKSKKNIYGADSNGFSLTKPFLVVFL